MAGLIWLWQVSEEPPPAPVTYMRPPSVDDDEPRAFTAYDFALLWAGATGSGTANGPLVDSTN